MARKIHELGFGQPANTAVSPRQVLTTYLKICSIIHTCIMISLDIYNGCLLVFSCDVKICFLKVKLALWLKCLEWSYLTRETGSNKLCQTASGKQKKTIALLTLQTFYLCKHDLLTVFPGKLDFLSVTDFSLGNLARGNFIVWVLDMSRKQ